MSWSSLIAAAASLGSAIIGSNAAKSASQQQSEALQQAAQTQSGATDAQLALLREMYQTTRADQAPWRDAGTNALAAMMQAAGPTYTQSPGYDFRMSEGIRAIDNAATARGMLGSGARDKALLRFGQGLAADDYNTWFNRLAGLAGTGQTATNATAASGQNFANNAAAATGQGATNLANIYGQQGNVAAAGTIGQANAYNNALKNALTIY
jgi:hypothetical protein